MRFPRRWVALGLVAMVIVAAGVWILRHRESSPPVRPVTKKEMKVAPADDPAKSTTYRAFYRQKVDWKSCQTDFQCAAVRVPVDWAKPTGQSLTLSVMRRPAGGTKIGSLFFNPGGPGMPGIKNLPMIAQAMPEGIRDAYDIISWDTRGAAQSSPITCLANEKLDAYFAMDSMPDTDAEFAALVKQSALFAKGCATNVMNRVVAHMDTASNARDLDVMRALVGDQVLTYFGASYGTYLGTRYTQMFGWRVGRMVLDGAVADGLTSQEYVAGQALGFSRALQDYLSDCVKRSCPLGSDVSTAQKKLTDLMTTLDKQPMATNGRPLTQALFVTGVLDGLYTRANWPALSGALRGVMTGNGNELLMMADDYMDRNQRGNYGQVMQAVIPTLCLDRPETRTPAQIRTDAQALGKKYPPFGTSIGFGALSCANWPEKAPPPPVSEVKNTRPIMVIGTTRDPATPYEWAGKLVQQLPGAVLLTRNGTGHTGFRQGSSCIDEAVKAYFLNGTMPAKGMVCQTS